MLKLEIMKDLKVETTVEGKRHECIAEMAIAVNALVNMAAETAGISYKEAEEMLCDGANQVHEVISRDESKD